MIKRKKREGTNPSTSRRRPRSRDGFESWRLEEEKEGGQGSRGDLGFLKGKDKLRREKEARAEGRGNGTAAVVVVSALEATKTGRERGRRERRVAMASMVRDVRWRGRAAASPKVTWSPGLSFGEKRAKLSFSPSSDFCQI